MTETERTSCIRCGTCCRKGGPALHQEDIPVLLSGRVKHHQLVTIRKGELVFDPVLDSLRPTDKELIKLRGRDSDWGCQLFDEATSECTIYEDRLLECRLLNCWDTTDLVAAIGKDTLVRTDIINPNDPIAEVIKLHERMVPLQEMQDLITRFSEGKLDRDAALQTLNELIHKDLAIRTNAFDELGLEKQYELFIFGRPLTSLLQSYGIQVKTASDEA